MTMSARERCEVGGDRWGSLNLEELRERHAMIDRAYLKALSKQVDLEMQLEEAHERAVAVVAGLASIPRDVEVGLFARGYAQAVEDAVAALNKVGEGGAMNERARSASDKPVSDFDPATITVPWIRLLAESVIERRAQPPEVPSQTMWDKPR